MATQTPTARTTYIVDGPGHHSEHRSVWAAIRAARQLDRAEDSGTVYVTMHAVSGSYASDTQVYPVQGETHTR